MATTETSSTHAAPEGGHGGGAFPPFETETFASQLLWLVITFGLLYALMSRVALPRVAAVLDTRADKLAGDLDEAQRLKARADEAGAAYDKSLADARANAKDIAQKNRDALNVESDKRRKILEAELHKKLEASDAALRKRTAEAMGNVRGIAADAAAAIVERLTGRAPEPKAVELALDRAAR